MNDDIKKSNQSIPPAVQTGQPQVQAQPVVPVGSPNKELEPVNGDKSQAGELSPSGVELNHEISQELKDIGVEEKKDRPDLNFEHKELGVDHAGPHIPVSTSPTGKVTMPMSEEEVSSQLKAGQDDDSGKWLAWLIKKIVAWGLRAR